MISRNTNIRAAMRSRQRGFLLNPYRFGSAEPEDPYWANVVSFMPLNQDPGTAVVDKTGRVWTGGDGLSFGTAPDGKKALAVDQFANEDSYLFTAASDGFNLGSTWTIEAYVWIAAAEPAVVMALLASANATWTPPAAIFGIEQDLVRYVQYGPPVINSAQPVLRGAWVHVAASMDMGRLRIFLRGLLSRDAGPYTQQSARFDNAGTYFLNTALVSNFYKFKGYMRFFRVTKGICRYVSDFTPPALT